MDLDGLERLRDQAACQTHPHKDWWWVEPKAVAGARTDPRFLAAQAVCRTCPVQADCLRWAIDNREEHGLWGGQWMPTFWRAHRRGKFTRHLGDATVLA